MLHGRLVFTPHAGRPERRYTFAGQATLGPIIGSVASGEGMVAPRGFDRDYAGVIVAEGLIRAA